MIKRFIPEFLRPKTNLEHFLYTLLGLSWFAFFAIAIISGWATDGKVLTTSDKEHTSEQTTTRTETKPRPSELVIKRVPLKFDTTEKYIDGVKDLDSCIRRNDNRLRDGDDKTMGSFVKDDVKNLDSCIRRNDKDSGRNDKEFLISDFTATDTTIFATGDTLRTTFSTELANRTGRFAHDFRPRPDSIKIIERVVTSVKEKIVMKEETFWDKARSVAVYIGVAAGGYFIGKTF